MTTQVTGSGVNFNGSTSGTITLTQPAVAGSNTLTLPALTGTLATTDGVLRTKLISFTRDATLANSSVAYTGVGFQPTAVLTFSADSSTNIGYNGFSDSSLGQASLVFTTSPAISGTTVIAWGASSAAYVTGQITSYDADGFTVSWVKTGAPGGTFTVKALCMR